MDLTFHPSAQQAFDGQATALVKLVATLRIGSSTPPFPTQQHIAAHITDADLIGEPSLGWADYRGNTVGRAFLHGGQPHGLLGKEYELLAKLADSIRKVSWAGEMLSQQFIEEQLFNWTEMRFKGSPTPDSFCTFLIQGAGQAIGPHTRWVPIANLEVESAFPIISSEVRPITKATINQWLNSAKGPSNQIDEIRFKLGERLRKYQGLAAVVTTVTAEPIEAAARAVDSANRAASALAIFSPGMLTPDVKTLSKLKGSEALARVTLITPPEAGGFGMAESVMDRSDKFWSLSSTEISLIRKAGLDAVSALFSIGKPTDFQRAVISSILIYSKAAFTSDSVEKVVFVLSSLESLLLKNQTESIQQNLGERLAVALERELAKRKAIIANVKEVYGIRSRYLHHGRPSSELDAIESFLKTAWTFYVNIAAKADAFVAREAFVNWLDDVKLSGTS